MTPRVSIVIPTYNEAADIGGTLDALIALEGPELEVIVADASNDATPEIVRAYPSPPVRLVRHERRAGRTGGRNDGIREARGEIVVILNADVRLPPDFLKRILPHYDRGADYVLVESRVSNLETATGRYVQALHEHDYPPDPTTEAQMHWTEGFSCRRQAAFDVGLFPETAVPMVAGEDGWFGERLAAAGHRKVFDRSIVVTHVAPPDLAGFWRQRTERGRGFPQVLRERCGRGWRSVAWTLTKASAWRALGLAFPARALWRGWRLSSRSPRGRSDWPALTALDWIAEAAALGGMWSGFLELRRVGAGRP